MSELVVTQSEQQEQKRELITQPTAKVDLTNGGGGGKDADANRS
jgi:hypothetical protein